MSVRGASEPGPAVLRRRRWLGRFAVAAGCAVAVIGALVLFGWARDVVWIRSLSVDWVSMKPNAALGFVLAGAGLLGLTVGDVRWIRTVARVLGAAVAAIGLVTLLEYVLGWNPGFDQMLFPEPPGASQTGLPGRMAPASALAFLASGLSLLFLDRRGKPHRAAEWLALVAGFIAFEVLVGYLYGPGFLTGSPALTRMAVLTAVAFALLSAGTLSARPDRGFAAFASSAGGEGVLLRKLLPAAALVPTLLGLVVLLTTESEAFPPSFAISLMVVAGTALLIVALLRTTSSVVEVERARREAESAYRQEATVVRTLNEVGEIITSEMDESSLVQEITDRATEYTSAAFGAFFYNVEDGEGRRYRLYSLSGAPREAFDRFPLPRGTPLFDQTFRGGPAVRLADVTRHPRYGRARPHPGVPEEELPVRSYLAVPVRSRDGEVLGGLFFGHPDVDRFTPAHERMAVGIASWAGIALDNARLLRRVQEAMQDREELVAVVSHDLRNALQAATSAARALELRSDGGDVGGGARAEEGRLTGIIQRSVTQMGRLIQDLLDIHVIQTGRLQVHPEPHPVGDLVRDAVELAEPLARDRGLTLHAEVDDDPVVNADRQRVIQVLNNLLGNAVKFTPAGGRVVVTARRDDDEVRVSVADTGPGIPEEALGRVFDRFWSGSGQEGGVGLGLAIARAIVESHGGWIRAENGAGGGALFVFALPVLPDVAEPEPAAEAGSSRAAGSAGPAAGDGVA